MLADRYQWTPAQIAAMDPDFLDEVVERIRAEADVTAAKRAEEEAEAEAERKSAEARRKAMEAKARRARRTQGGSYVEDADVSEIR